MNLIDFFDGLRYWGGKRNPLLQKIRYYKIVNGLVTIIANKILPAYFSLTANRSKNRLSQSNKNGSGRIIVSLTSYPVRLPQLWEVIECLFRQSIKPDKIVLYLTEEQVGNDIDSLPKSLLKQRKRGLEIRLCKDTIKSHTKYFYAFQEFSDDFVITVDDDLFYRTDLIENLLRWHKEYPEAIISNWVKDILPTTSFYKEWPDVHVPRISDRFLLLGVGGVLYPPQSLYKDVFDISLIQKLCLTADDVWISCMALLAKMPICFTGYRFAYLPVLIKNNTTLLAINRERNQVCIDKLNNYYQNQKGIKPFIDLVQ